MWHWWHSRGKRDTEDPVPMAGGRPARLAAGERVYAVGDVHGRSDLVATMEAEIGADLRARPPAGEVTIVYLGDYVDRGVDSRGVLDLLTGLAPRPARRRLLIGNHDWWLRNWLETGDLARAWLQSGADATIASYGLPPLPPLADGEAVARARRTVLRRMPPGHRRLLNELRSYHRQGDYLFVHAGVRPGLPLDAQQARDLMFIREPFLSEAADLGFVVVHGHTVVEAPVVRVNRIGIDTGAHRSGRLTAVALEGAEQRFITARVRETRS